VDPVAQVDQHRLPARSGHAQGGPAERRAQDDQADHQDHHHPTDATPVEQLRRGGDDRDQHAEDEDGEPGQGLRSQDQVADDQRDDERGQGDDGGQAVLRQPDQHAGGAEQEGGHQAPLAQPAYDVVPAPVERPAREPAHQAAGLRRDDH
jgi:hypothetical protein